MKILLREVMIRSLEKERYVVESAANYQDALLKINDYDYGLYRAGYHVAGR